MGDQARIDALLTNLRSNDYQLRKAAAQALGQLRAPEAVAPLMTLIADSPPWLRDSAVDAIVALGPVAVEALIGGLQSAKREVRQSCTEGLGRIRDSRAVPALLDCLKDRNCEIVPEIAAALGEIGDRGTVPTLISLLQAGASPGEVGGGFVREAAAKALGNIGDPTAVDPLRRALRDRETYVQDAAGEALAKIPWKR